MWVKIAHEAMLSHLHLCILYFHPATLSVITNAVGGIIDDCIITRTGPNSFYLVTNAGREDVDMTHMKVLHL